jgi:hypothetical protein
MRKFYSPPSPSLRLRVRRASPVQRIPLPVPLRVRSGVL